MDLRTDEKMDIDEILKDLASYRPKRHGWHWREKAESIRMGPFEYRGNNEAAFKLCTLFLHPGTSEE